MSMQRYKILSLISEGVVTDREKVCKRHVAHSPINLTAFVGP